MSPGEKFSIETYRIVLRLLETRSFTTTAGEFGITQSAVTQKLQKFQDVWRTKLLERRGNEFILTRDGTEFRAKFRPLVDQFISTDFRAGKQKLARVAVSTSFVAGDLVKRALDGLEGQIELRFESDKAISYLAASNSIDVAITLAPIEKFDAIEITRLTAALVGPDCSTLLRVRDADVLTALVEEHLGDTFQSIVEFPDSGSLLESARLGIGQGLVVASDAQIDQIGGRKINCGIDLYVLARNDTRAREYGERFSKALSWAA